MSPSSKPRIRRVMGEWGVLEPGRFVTEPLFDLKNAMDYARAITLGQPIMAFACKNSAGLRRGADMMRARGGS